MPLSLMVQKLTVDNRQTGQNQNSKSTTSVMGKGCLQAPNPSILVHTSPVFCHLTDPFAWRTIVDFDDDDSITGTDFQTELCLSLVVVLYNTFSLVLLKVKWF